MIFLSVYLTSRYDYHKNIQLKSDDFCYIENYYNSIKKLKLKSKIFVDTCSKKFIMNHKTNYINFIFDPLCIIKKNTKNTVTNNMLIHDLRFILFRNYLYHKKHSHYFLSDISDVEILNDPKILNDDYIYVGEENENIFENKWFQIYIKDMDFIDKYFPDYQNILNNKMILNCGTIFGNYSIIKKFLDLFHKYLFILYKNENIKRPLDMFLTNYISYKFFPSKLRTKNFSTVFGHQQHDYTKIVKHK
jgi:hypothetical protein